MSDGFLPFLLKQSALGAPPLLLAGYGELLAQRAGVINVGIEGTMLMGTIAAFGAAVVAGNAGAAIPSAILAGVLMGALFALVTVWLRADQIVAGTAMNLVAAGASTTAWYYVQRHAQNGHNVPPLFEPVWLGQYGLFYVALAAGTVLWAVMQFTRAGLVVQALGDAPDACDAAGIRVRLWRTGLVLLAGGLAGLAGAYLSTMRGHSFQINMTDGRGFLVLALVIFGRWNLAGLVLVTFAFGAVDGLQSYLAAMPKATAAVPHQLFDMLPYVATLLALGVLTRSRGGPIYLGRPWPE
jgi:simple sugar transport system permease protein